MNRENLAKFLASEWRRNLYFKTSYTITENTTCPICGKKASILYHAYGKSISIEILCPEHSYGQLIKYWIYPKHVLWVLQKLEKEENIKFEVLELPDSEIPVRLKIHLGAQKFRKRLYRVKDAYCIHIPKEVGEKIICAVCGEWQ